MDDALQSVSRHRVQRFPRRWPCASRRPSRAVRTDIGIKLYRRQSPDTRAEGRRDRGSDCHGAAGPTTCPPASARVRCKWRSSSIGRAFARYGLNVADVRRAVETGIGGRAATEIIEGRKRFPVVVRLAEPYRDAPDAIGQLLLNDGVGRPESRCRRWRRFRSSRGPSCINHEDGQRMVIVQSNVRGSDLASSPPTFSAKSPRACRCRRATSSAYSGQFENQQRAMRRLALIVPAVLLLIGGSCTRASAT